MEMKKHDPFGCNEESPMNYRIKFVGVKTRDDITIATYDTFNPRFR